MAKRPLKSKKPNTLKRVLKEVEPEPVERPYWYTPSESYLKLDEARLNHWRAKLEGGDVVATLKAWAALLHVPKTRVTNGVR